MFAKVAILASILGLVRSGGLQNAGLNIGRYGTQGAYAGAYNGLAGNPASQGGAVSHVSIVKEISSRGPHGSAGAYPGASGLYNGAAGLYNGAGGLYNGAGGLYNGAGGLYNGVGGLHNGAAGLYNSGASLYNGAAGLYSGATGWPHNSADYAGAAGLPYAGAVPGALGIPQTGLPYAGAAYPYAGANNLAYAGAGVPYAGATLGAYPYVGAGVPFAGIGASSYPHVGTAGYPYAAGAGHYASGAGHLLAAGIAGGYGRGGVPTSYSNIYNGPLRSNLANTAYGAGSPLGYGGYGNKQAW